MPFSIIMVFMLFSKPHPESNIILEENEIIHFTIIYFLFKFLLWVGLGVPCSSSSVCIHVFYFMIMLSKILRQVAHPYQLTYLADSIVYSLLWEICPFCVMLKLTEGKKLQVNFI